MPAEPGEVQQEVNIDKEGSFIITVKVGEARLVECESRFCHSLAGSGE